MKKCISKNMLIATLLLVLTSIQMKGQSDSEKSPRLEEMTLEDLLNVKVTTATKTSQTMQQAPATMIVITAEQIKIRGYRSLLDVMADAPEYIIEDKVRSMIRNNIIVRGVPGQEKFAILLDGVRISSPTNEALPVMENYPVNLADHIEIVYGPASALYGADALSGVINIISKKSPVTDITAEASTEIGMYGLTNSTLFLNKKLSADASLVISGQFMYDQTPDYSKLYDNDSLWDFTSHKTGTFNSIYGPMTPSAPAGSTYESPMSAYNGYVGLHIKGFDFSYFRNMTKTPSSYENNPSNAVYNKDVYMEQTVDVASAGYVAEIGNLTSTTTLSFSEYNLDPKSSFRNLYNNLEYGYKYAFGSETKIEEQLEWKLSKGINLVGGVTFEHYYSIPKCLDLEEPISEDNSLQGTMLDTKSYYKPEGLPATFYYLKYMNTGGYFQINLKPSEKFSLTLGARYDDNSRYGSTFNPRAGIIYTPGNKTTVKALFGTAFIAPSPLNAYESYGSFYTNDSGQTYNSFYWKLPNPNLKPMKGETAELSINHNMNNHFNIGINGFYSHLTNLFSQGSDMDNDNLYGGKFYGYNVDYIEITINQGKQNCYGGSLQLNYKNKIGNIKMNSYAYLSYLDGVLKDENSASEDMSLDKELDFISNWTLKAGIEARAGKVSCSARLIFSGLQNISGVKDTINNILQRQHLKGYALLNVSIQYQFTKHFSVFSNVLNALNQEYKSTGWDMDLTKTNYELFHGANQDPIRVSGGINFTF